MSYAPDWTLLVQDLLSPAGTQLADNTSALISYHLGTTKSTEHDKLATLARTITASPSLWHSTPYEPSPGLSPGELPLEVVQLVFNATRNGLLYRIEQIKQDQGSGWSGQRELGRWLKVVLESVRESGAGVNTSLVVVGGILSGLQQTKLQKDKMYVGGGSMTGLVEKKGIEIWGEYLGGLDGQFFATVWGLAREVCHRGLT